MSCVHVVASGVIIPRAGNNRGLAITGCQAALLLRYCCCVFGGWLTNGIVAFAPIFNFCDFASIEVVQHGIVTDDSRNVHHYYALTFTADYRQEFFPRELFYLGELYGYAVSSLRGAYDDFVVCWRITFNNT